MQIFVKAETTGKIPEWRLLEFQGSFEKRDDNRPLHGEHIGDLNYTKDGVPFFITGHHIIYGHEVKLSKPMVVMRQTLNEDSMQREYLVQAVVRRKVLFRSRPIGIISIEAMELNKT